MTTPRPCRGCGGVMSRGYVADRTRDGAKASTWIEGEPQTSFWKGVTVPKGNRQLDIATWRCERCGLLESYAA